jgi:hypothetical protein
MVPQDVAGYFRAAKEHYEGASSPDAMDFVAGTCLGTASPFTEYFRRHHRARNPSLQPIFLPSS